MPRHYAAIERFLGSEPDSYLIIHLEMGSSQFEIWLNASDDDPTRQIIATRHPWSATEIHIVVGYLTNDPKRMDKRAEQDIHCETVEQGMNEFIRLFDYCLALGVNMHHPRGENLILDVFRQRRNPA